MNFTISVIFRAIPLVMGAICLAYGLYILNTGDDANHYVSGHVNVALTAICYALFATAATIIRQLIHRYGPFWRIVLPLSGYIAALAAMIWGIVIVFRGGDPDFVTAGHIVFGIGLVAACVSTVAAASTTFTLIPVNNTRKPEDGPPEGAHSQAASLLMMAVPLICAIVGFVVAYILFAGGAPADYVAGHVVFGLSIICVSLIALVASVVRQIGNTYGPAERHVWTWFVVLMGSINVCLGLYLLFGTDAAWRIAPGVVLIGLGMICYSILSKVLLLALVWRQTFELANRIPLIPVFTALTCLFFAAFLFQANESDPQFYVGSHVMVGLGAVCFTLFSIVSILEAGTSG